MVEYILNQLVYFTTHFIGAYGYLAVIALMAMESANIPFPSELIMPFAGFLVAKGDLNLLMVVIAGVFGNWLGSALSYWLGATGGRTVVLRYGRYVHLSERHLDEAERWFAKYGDWSVCFGRLLPIVRTFISLPAGFAKMNFAKFSVFTILGAFPFCYLLAWLGFKLGERWDDLRKYFHYLDALVIIGLLLLVLYVWQKKRLKKLAQRVTL